jgi:hypothetical protein
VSDAPIPPKLFQENFGWNFGGARGTAMEAAMEHVLPLVRFFL